MGRGEGHEGPRHGGFAGYLECGARPGRVASWHVRIRGARRVESVPRTSARSVGPFAIANAPLPCAHPRACLRVLFHAQAAEKDTDHSALPSRGDGGLTAAERLGAPAPTQLPPDRKRDVDQIMWGAERLRKEIEASSAGAAPLGSRQAVILRERNEKVREIWRALRARTCGHESKRKMTRVRARARAWLRPSSLTGAPSAPPRAKTHSWKPCTRVARLRF